MKLVFKNVIIAVAATLACFMTVGYTACKKVETTPIDDCAGIVCKNGATCFKGMCSCPSGFEGKLCEVDTRARFIGNWTMKERIIGSTVEAKINTTAEYEITVKEQPETRLNFLIDNFRGNAAYDGVVCSEGRNSKYEPSNYKDFVFERSQNIAGTDAYIVRGSGSVNDLGTYFEGTYIVNYLENAELATDTVSFSADIIR